ncbi:MAG: choice-of-anchor J domain-containing protein [Deltaproteobacteria bacterium]|nr:choice-of-anchor J domain-containing protein [Deltaproteobacteria bacterium]
MTPVLLLLACQGAPVDTGDPVVLAGPVLAHQAPEGDWIDGDTAVLTVQAVDPDGVAGLTLYYRDAGAPIWAALELEEAEGGWSGALALSEPGLEYWFRAVDASQMAMSASLPAAGEEAPFALPVGARGLSLPFSEDFEAAEGSGALYRLGWDQVSRGFEGAPWELRSDQSHSPTQAATHRRGAEGVDPLEDWLIAPPLDLSGESAIQLTWWEQGDYADLGDHALLIHTASGDPDAEGWEEVTVLGPPPEDAWGRTALADLSPWAGERTAWLAWVYRGQYADAWYVDDVAVGPLGPDLQVVDWTWTEVDPGGSSTVYLTVENRSSVGAEDLELALAVDPSAGTATGMSGVSLGAGASTLLSGQVVVSPDYPDNAWLPVAVTLREGEREWSAAERIVVGAPSTASLSLIFWQSAWASVEVGVGPLDAPEWVAASEAGLWPAGPQVIEVDLTDAGGALPPGPGADRWWARLRGQAGTTVQDFSIAWDGESWTQQPLATLPAEGLVLWLPPPPSPELLSSVTAPALLEPGMDASWELTLINRGAATTGRTVATIRSEDPAVSGLPVGELLVSEGPWGAGEQVSWTLSPTIAFDKVDSAPISVSIALRDEVEGFAVGTSLEVPWPALALTRLAVDDWADGNNDGLLSEGEQANLELTVVNRGARGTQGPVRCALSADSGPLSVIQGEGDLGSLAPGDAATEDDFVVRADPGAPGGSALELSLSCADDRGGFLVPVRFALGERPWEDLTLGEDRLGDSASGADLRGGRWRVVGDTLELELRAWAPVDPETLFIELWASSVGSPWTWFQGVFQSGYGVLRGYDDGVFTRLSEPSLTVLDQETVLLRLDLTSMDLALDTLSLGFGAGFCGGSTYYCDHYPDGWGDPYQAGLNTSVWADLSW